MQIFYIRLISESSACLILGTKTVMYVQHLAFDLDQAVKLLVMQTKVLAIPTACTSTKTTSLVYCSAIEFSMGK